MTISYNWLCEYLPEKIAPDELSKILTSLGLEVESLEKYEEFKGGLEGLVIGEVLTCEKHPGADKLKLTTVNTGDEALKIVCGAPNVAVGQKVVVAPVGSTIYPISGEPMQMKKAKIRGEESQGMICAADEIGLGEDHSGIIILPDELVAGKPASEYFKPYSDYIIEIGLTPNRMDAMSHLGVARDVAAYLSHHRGGSFVVKDPLQLEWPASLKSSSIEVELRNPEACARYAGILIKDIKVEESPTWLQQKLKAIGVRSINNIVDITNYILHETGQPLHAFDFTAITGQKIIVETLPEGTPFITLDEKERKLSSEDLMICNGKDEPMCIGGVFGGITSGVNDDTTSIFLESAWFNPVSIRRSSLRHGLRTDAATRFEKGVDISNTVKVMQRAALMIKELAGGIINENFIDIYPVAKEKTRVSLSYDYLLKLSGKKYDQPWASSILKSLGFEVIDNNEKIITVAVPFSKPDISIPADIVEEIMRVDGLDNIEIPTVISIAPSVEREAERVLYKEKIADMLVGRGFYEIFTNSITNSAYYTKEQSHVKMKNNLSADLDMMRPSMLETGLESVAYNINRQNRNLQLFEFGKVYSTQDSKFIEEEQFCLYVTGSSSNQSWRSKQAPADLYYLKGVCDAVASAFNFSAPIFKQSTVDGLEQALEILIANRSVGYLGYASAKILESFSIKQPVCYARFDLEKVFSARRQNNSFKAIPKFPSVQRDLSMIVPKTLHWGEIEEITLSLKLKKLKSIKLFDLFEHEKLGADNKSLAINYTFLDEEKTLTDKETDEMMSKIINVYENQLKATVRKG
jgi:phenylalanyl-tRNA synthetase beta chain